MSFRFSDNVFLGVGLGFFIGQLFLQIRQELGTRRLSETALIDERFLL